MGNLARLVSAAVCIALIILSGRMLYASAQQQLAAETADAARQIRHLAIAQALLPWDPTIAGKLAVAAVSAGDRTLALQASRQAVSQAPADARVWNRHAHILAQTGQFGPELAVSIQRTIALAPLSPVLRLEQALLAAKHWPRADPAARELWEENARFVAETQMEDFARAAAAVNLDLGTCALAGNSLEVWCNHIDAWRKACQQSGLRPKQQRGCRGLGLL